MICLGLYGRTLEPDAVNVQDAGVSLFADGRHVCSMSQERLSRHRHDGSFPQAAIDTVLQVAGVPRDRVQVVCLARTPATLSVGESRVQEHLKPAFPNARIVTCGHHQAHALAAFFTSPYPEATVLSFDTGGDILPAQGQREAQNELAIIGLGSKKGGLRRLGQALTRSDAELDFPVALVLKELAQYCYREAAPERSNFLNEAPLPDSPDRARREQRLETLPEKIVGLAAQGNSQMVNLPASFTVVDNGYHLPSLESTSWMTGVLRGDMSQEIFSRLAGFTGRDLAAWLNRVCESALVEFLRRWPYRQRYLCLAGGGSLTTLPRRIIDERLFEDVHVFPGNDDSGLCVGAAIWASLLAGDRNIQMPVNLAALGLTYEHNAITAAWNAKGAHPIAFDTDDAMLDAVVERLTSGKTVGWRQGRSEIGPRGMGMSCILADARRADVGEQLNSITGCEWWRPTTPVVLEQHANEWFVLDRPSPYMKLTAKLREPAREKTPGVAQRDNPVTVQTVNERQNPHLAVLLAKFHQKTGVPLLATTSFCAAEEPLVETPADAIDVWQRLQLDSVAMGRSIADKS